MNSFKILISSLLLMLVAGNLAGQNTRINPNKKISKVKNVNIATVKPAAPNVYKVEHDLNGTWKDQNGNPFYIKQVGGDVYWFGEEKSRSRWAHVYVGRISRDKLSGTFYDVPKGGNKGKGDLTFDIADNRLTLANGSGFGSTTLTRSRRSTLLGNRYLGPKDEQFKEYNTLTGLWHGTNGGRYYVRQVGDDVVWFGEDITSTGRSKSGFANVAYGKKTGNKIQMVYVDVPKGRANGKGNFTLTVEDNKVMTKDKNFGASRYVKEGALGLSTGIVKKDQLTSLLNILLSTLKIHINNYGPRHGNSWFKPNDTWIEILGNRTILTDIAEEKRGAKNRKSYYINDFNLSKATTDFSGDQLQLTMIMEADDPEIKGRCNKCKFGTDNRAADANLTNPRFLITADIIAQNCSITIDVKEVEYLGGFDGRGFLEFAEWILDEKIRPSLVNGLRDGISTNRSRFADALRQYLGGKCVKSVNFKGDKIIFNY